MPRLSTAPSESVSYSKISVNVFIGSSLWGPSHQETIRGKADNWTWPKQCGRESIELSFVQSFHNKTLWRSWEPGMILLKLYKHFSSFYPRWKRQLRPVRSCGKNWRPITFKASRHLDELAGKRAYKPSKDCELYLCYEAWVRRLWSSV